MFRSLRLLGVATLLVSTAACSGQNEFTAPSNGSVTSASATTPTGKSLAEGNAVTTFGVSLYCSMPASPPRVPQKWNDVTGEHVQLVASIDGGAYTPISGYSVEAPIGAKIKWVATVVDRNNKVVTDYSLETPTTEVTVGSNIELVFSRDCGGTPPPVAPSCAPAQSTIHVGESITFMTDGRPIPTWTVNGGNPEPIGPDNKLTVNYDKEGSFSATSKNEAGEAKCTVTVLPKKVDPLKLSCSPTQVNGKVGQLIKLTVDGFKTGTTPTWKVIGGGATKNTAVGPVFETDYSEGHHVTEVSDGEQKAQCTVDIAPPDATCDMVSGNLDLVVRTIDATHAAVTPRADLAGPNNTAGTLIVNGKPATPNETLTFERYGPGVPNDVNANLTLSLNGKSCKVIPKTVAIPPQEDHGNPCYQVVDWTKIAPGVIDVTAKTVGNTACIGGGVHTRIRLDVPFVSYTAVARTPVQNYTHYEESWGNDIVFAMGDIQPMTSVTFRVTVNAPGMSSASVCSTDDHSGYTYMTCASTPVPLP